MAADYLVMAAWLAYLKSKLLIPQQAKGDDGPSGEELAATLAFRLKRLEAMREAATRLVNRNRLGRDVFARGAPEHIPHSVASGYDATLYDLLSAYANLRQRTAVTQVTIERRKVWSLVDARELLTRMLGEVADWTALQHYLLPYLPGGSRHGDRQCVCRVAGTGARRQARNSAGRRFPADLPAQGARAAAVRLDVARHGRR